MLVGVGIRVLEAMFLAGWAGSVLVLLLSGIEDAATIFEKDEPAPSPKDSESSATELP